ncbi:MAG: aldehyde dehydrogenase family protein [Methylotenera sp.]|nr:aldehyde dehydrogenase family protein [Oligoflexia bacterium]
MAQARFEFSVQGNYIDGKFQRPPEVNGELINKSPADFKDEIGRFPYSYSSVDASLGAAKRAFKPWKNRPLQERAELLRKYQAAVRRREEEFMEIISREVGKPLWESKTEVSALLAKVDVTINDSMKLVADLEIPGIMENTHGSCTYRPLGVMAVIGPFNFPAHLPNGHIVPALLTGNTVVFKPSEKTPMVAQLMAECFHEAGFPAGVFNLIQGEKEVGRRLCIHESVDGILFTGSYEVGTRIKQDTLQQHWKLLALEMGGKNSAIVWDDANMDLALHETLIGGFMTAGQRCSSTSRIIVQSSKVEEFVQKFHTKAKAFSIGHPLDNPFMGPLIDSGSTDRYLKFLGIASREGCEIIMRGKALDLSPQGNYVAPSICWVQDSSLAAAKKSVYQQTELFAPNVAILSADTIEDAVELANVTQYGLVSSVFTQSRETYTYCKREIEAGLINWNKSTVGASSRLPFGGLKKSGNHFPTALTSVFYCTTPVASLAVEDGKSITNAMPGLNWK